MVTVEEVRLDVMPLHQRGNPDSANHAAEASKEGNIKGATNSTREENNSAIPEKPSDDGYNWQTYTPKNIKGAANASREENNSMVPEKPSDDGYNWRKYGQKNIKGNKHTRSYYKCSYQQCLVKKQIERAPDGRITDTCYFGKHDHPKPQTGLGAALPSILSTKVQTGDDRSSGVAEGNSSSAHNLPADDAELMETNELTPAPTSAEGIQDVASPSSLTKDYGNTDENVASKRRKTEDDYDMSMDNKSNSKSRWVVETVSAVDIVNDGFRWRKYGQKLVKDNPNARSYYRCTNPGCPAKKRVERASHDPNVVITTYEGQHDHDAPQGRTLLYHSCSPAASTASGHNCLKPDDVIRAQSTAEIRKEEGNSTEHTDEKGNAPEEVNPAQITAAIRNKEQSSNDNLAEKNHQLEEVYRAQSSTVIKQEGISIDHPTEKDGLADEVKQAQSSAVTCKQEQDNPVDLPAKKEDMPEEVTQDENRVAVCEQEKGNTIDDPAEKDDLAEKVNQGQSSATICEQEQGSTTDHPAEKSRPIK